VNWNNVGYYDNHTDKLNNFRWSSSTATTATRDFDFEFNYSQVSETGDASEDGGWAARQPRSATPMEMPAPTISR
jgi:hypothetical protein